MGLFSEIFFDSLLLMYRDATDFFHVLILYAAALLKFFISFNSFLVEFGGLFFFWFLYIRTCHLPTVILSSFFPM